MTALIRLACALLLLTMCGRVQAQSSAGPSEATARARIARVQSLLDERTGRAGLWQYGFMGLGYHYCRELSVGSGCADARVDKLDNAGAIGRGSPARVWFAEW